MAISHIPRSIGHNYVPEYQISALPYNTTSQSTSEIVVKSATGEVVEGADPAAPDAGAGEVTIAQIEFPKITQWLQFKGGDSAINVYFSKKDAAAGNSNCLQIDIDENTFPLRLRCTNIYFIKTRATDLQIRSGLTSINRSEFSGMVEIFLGDTE